jgi:hypothetical protein
MDMGPYVEWRKTSVPTVPPDSAFAQAGTWQLRWNKPDMTGLSEVLLQMDYAGDIARLSSSGTVLDDNFFNGLSWQVGLKGFGVAAAPLTRQILPMPTAAPIYLDPLAQKVLDSAKASPQLNGAKLVPEYEAVSAISY